MTIGEQIKAKDHKTYRKLQQIKEEKPKRKAIKLGDSIENLMSADSYKRTGGTIRQTRWGK